LPGLPLRGITTVRTPSFVKGGLDGGFAVAAVGGDHAAAAQSG
jgi:hypothetical protein